MSAAVWVLTAVAGAAGATSRFVIDYVVSSRVTAEFPWGTGIVNVTGCLLIGVVAGLAGPVLPAESEFVLAVGFCGSYTTFSTHMVENVRLLGGEGRSRALANIVGSLLAGVAAVVVGLGLAGLLLG